MKNFTRVLLSLVFVAVFNALFFIIGGTEHEVSVWVAYGFIHFAYLMYIITPMTARNHKHSYVFALSLGKVSIVYFAVEFVVNMFFILLSLEGYKFCLVVNILISGVYAVALLSNIFANESSYEQVKRQDAELNYVKGCAASLDVIASQTEDRALKRQIEDVRDLVHSSQSRSDPSVRDLERGVKEQIEMLSGYVKSGRLDDAADMLKKIKNCAEERNIRLMSTRR